LADSPTVYMQTIETPLSHIDPEAFFRATRRQLFHVKTGAIAGFGLTDEVPLRQFGVVSGLEIRIYGSITTGTTASPQFGYRWPYGILRGVRLSANGQNQLISVNGIALRALQMMTPTSEDRGVAHFVGAAAVTQGTLGFASENWGSITSGVTAETKGQNSGLTISTQYFFDLSFFVPIAFDQRYLTGALYASTASTAIGLSLDWANLADVLTVGAATATYSVNYSVHEIVYEIPVIEGHPVLPDLSAFHGLVTSRATGQTQLDNEFTLPGTSAGRMLERLYGSVWTGTAPGQPLPVNEANYGQLAWKYGGSGIPESVTTGRHLRYLNERQFNADIGAVWGYWCFDFANEWSLRDALNEGNYTDLRVLYNLVNAPTTPYAEITQETVFGAALSA
jgi:hypothetical protein